MGVLTIIMHSGNSGYFCYVILSYDNVIIKLAQYFCHVAVVSNCQQQVYQWRKMPNGLKRFPQNLGNLAGTIDSLSKFELYHIKRCLYKHR